MSRTKKKKTRKQKRETRSLAPLMPSPLESARLMELQLNLVSPLSRFLSFLPTSREGPVEDVRGGGRGFEVLRGENERKRETKRRKKNPKTKRRKKNANGLDAMQTTCSPPTKHAAPGCSFFAAAPASPSSLSLTELLMSTPSSTKGQREKGRRGKERR